MAFFVFRSSLHAPRKCLIRSKALFYVFIFTQSAQEQQLESLEIQLGVRQGLRVIRVFKK